MLKPFESLPSLIMHITLPCQRPKGSPLAQLTNLYFVTSQVT